MDEYNRERREQRRIHRAYMDDDLTLFKDKPSLQEIKDALREVPSSHTAIIRLAALMNNLAMFEERRVCTGPSGRDYRDKTDGIKAFLRKDGYLYSRYSCLMRYKKLGKLIRAKSGVGVDANLLWGLEPECPLDDGEPLFEEEYVTLHTLYASFTGMTFKEMQNRLE